MDEATQRRLVDAAIAVSLEDSKKQPWLCSLVYIARDDEVPRSLWTSLVGNPQVDEAVAEFYEAIDNLYEEHRMCALDERIEDLLDQASPTILGPEAEPGRTLRHEIDWDLAQELTVAIYDHDPGVDMHDLLRNSRNVPVHIQLTGPHEVFCDGDYQEDQHRAWLGRYPEALRTAFTQMAREDQERGYPRLLVTVDATDLWTLATDPTVTHLALSEPYVGIFDPHGGSGQFMQLHSQVVVDLSTVGLTTDGAIGYSWAHTADAYMNAYATPMTLQRLADQPAQVVQVAVHLIHSGMATQQALATASDLTRDPAKIPAQPASGTTIGTPAWQREHHPGPITMPTASSTRRRSGPDLWP